MSFILFSKLQFSVIQARNLKKYSTEYQPYRIGKRMCIKSATSFVKIFSSFDTKSFTSLVRTYLFYKQLLSDSERLTVSMS